MAKEFLKLLGLYVLNVLVGFDQLFNAIAFGAPDETISSRLGRNYPNSVITKLVNILFFWQDNHTKKYIEPELMREDAILK